MIATVAEATTEDAVTLRQEHVLLSVEVSLNKTAPATDVSVDDYVDAGEEYIIYYSPEPDRKPDTIDYEAEDYVRNGNDADYDQRMVDRVFTAIHHPRSSTIGPLTRK